MQKLTKIIIQMIRKAHIELFVSKFLDILSVRNRILKYYNLIDKVRNYENSSQLIQVEKHDKILHFCFFSVRGSASTLSWEYLIAKSLQLRGHEVYFVLCDGGLEKKCEMASINYRTISCGLCYAFGEELLKEANIPVIKFSEFINEEERKEILNLINNKKDFDDYLSFIYENVKIGNHANASTLRYMGRGTLIRNYKTLKILKHYIKSALISSFVSKNVVKKLRPDRIITSHGIYVSWGPILDIANSTGIPITTCDRTQGYMNLIFNRNKPNYENEDNEFERKYMQKQLDKNQEELLTTFLVERWMKNRTVHRYNKIPIQKEKFLIERLDLNSEKPIFLLFTNVLWDAANVGRDLAFENAISWILETIDWFTKHLEFQLVIKIHPAESIFKDVTNQRVNIEIMKKFARLSENIKIIPSVTDLNTYDIIDNVNFCIVYTSTVGLEAILREKPVIVTGKVHYRGKGFTYDIEKKQSYFELLKNPNQIILTDKMHDKARRYAYFYFTQRLIPFHFIIEKEPFKPIDFSINNYSELIMNRTFDTICEGLIEHSPIINSSL